MNEDESVCVTKEVHVNQNSNSEVIADVINRRSRSGWKKFTLILAAYLP